MKQVFLKSQLKSEIQRAKSILKMVFARTLNKIDLVLISTSQIPFVMLFAMEYTKCANRLLIFLLCRTTNQNSILCTNKHQK